jgi:hypothetical protein
MAGLISLDELRALGEFVRWQDVADRLLAVGYEGKSYPLMATWGKPEKTVDVCIEGRWQRATLSHLTKGRMYFAADSMPSILASDSTVAPAGYYTEALVPIGIELAELSSKYKIPGHEIQDARIIDVHDAYITFEVRHYPASSRWVDDFWRSEETFHFKDPRVTLANVPNPASYNRPIAVSHRWLHEEAPDIRGEQYGELLAWCETTQVAGSQAFMIDFCCLPQRPRTELEEQRFREAFPQLQNFFSVASIILSSGSDDYSHRAWCMLECMLAAKANAVHNLDTVTGDVREAYDQSRGLVETLRWKFQAIQKHRHDPRGFAGDQQAVIAYSAHHNVTSNIRERFKSEFLLQFEADRELILDVLERELLGLKVKTQPSWPDP